MYALGWTQHSHGSQNIRTAAMIQLLCGNIGVPGRRHQRAARPLERAGHHRHRHAGDEHARLHGVADRCRADAREPPLPSAPSRPCRRTRPATGRTTASSTSASSRACTAAKATPQNEFGYAWLPKVDVAYDVLSIKMFDVMHKGGTTGLLCQGFNPLMSIAYKAKTVGCAREAEVPGQRRTRSRPTPSGSGRPRRVQRRRHRRDPDRGVYAADHLLRRGGRHADQLEPGGAVEVEGRRPRSASRAPTSTCSPTSSCGLRKLYEEEGGTAPEPLLAVDWSYGEPARADARRDPGGAQRQGAGGSGRRRGQGHPQGRRAARELRRDEGRRLDRRRPVDLHRRLRAERQPRAATGQLRPERAQRLRQLGLRLAGQPAHPLQPRLGRSSGQGVEQGEEVHRSGTAPSGAGPTCPTSSPPNRRSAGRGRSS